MEMQQNIYLLLTHNFDLLFVSKYDNDDNGNGNKDRKISCWVDREPFFQVDSRWMSWQVETESGDRKWTMLYLNITWCDSDGKDHIPLTILISSDVNNNDLDYTVMRKYFLLSITRPFCMVDAKQL